eukprot:s3274_g2.t1
MRTVGREVAWAKNSLVREHGWSPVALVFGKEPRVYGELHGEGEPIAYHPRVGDPGSEVARRMQYRYHAKLEYIRAQARHMLARTAHNRVRKITQPRIGQLVFFWRGERKREPSRWVGPGYVVGIQGTNAWVAVGGRCFLVAGEHLREACGDEKQYGDPQIQKAIALFKTVPKEATFEDLTLQSDPTEEPMEVESQPFVQEVSAEAGNLNEGKDGLPEVIRALVQKVGWCKDAAGNPAVVSRQAWAFRTPETRFELNRFPYRSTWARFRGQWMCLEEEVKWLELANPNSYLPNGPAELMITVFRGLTKREMCLEDVPHGIKKRRAVKPEPSSVNTVIHGKTVGKNKLKRMMDKEIPYDKIPLEQRELYHQAQEKEWSSWREYESCEILSEEESTRVMREMPERVLPSRYVYRNKNAGLVDEAGKPLPIRAKARLCLQGHLCPDARTGQVQVDSPTVERVSTMIFLHVAISFGWVSNWFIGDISNAFLQGAPLIGKEAMFMKPPKQGLKGVKPGQILKLLKPVYGRPDAPRAWYEELARVLTEELGFVKSCIDPAVFMLRNHEGLLCGLMAVHVDDLMVCHDGSGFSKKIVDKLSARFPFGTWDKVSEKPNGVTYCGKEIRLQNREGEQCIVLSQDSFIDGRLEEMEISKDRKRTPELQASDEEKANYRSVVGSLQWIATQSRPDLSFETNQLQKRVADLRVADLSRANKAVREAKQSRMEVVFRNLGRDAQLIVYTDAGLYSSVGVEINERETDDILQSSFDKRLVFSQKGAIVGFVKRGATEVRSVPAHINVLDWRSSTNKRVVESSFAAETHAALMALGMGHFSQVLISELRFGSDVVGSVEDDGWNDLTPMTLVTDCKSIYDTVHKDGQHISDKASVIHAASVVLLYRIAGAMGRLASTPTADAEAHASALDWWQLAEAAGRRMPDGQGSHIVALQRLIAISTMPEQSPGIWGEGGAWIDVHASARAAVACVAREDAGAVPQTWLHVVEALWALASCTMHWQDRHCQCPGGIAVTAQCAALTSLMLLFRGQSKARSLRVQQPAADAAEEPWLRWPAFRSALLQLRVVSQASHLYKWLGEADLADACCQCGLQLISQRLCGDHRWKLRFLCMRARSAMAQSSRLPDMAGLKDAKAPELARLLAEIDVLWNGKMQASAKMGTEAAVPWECLELWAEAGTMAVPCWRGFPELGRSWKLRLTALAAQRRRCPEAWAAHIDGLLSWMRAMPDKPLPHLGQMLLTVAQVFFDEAIEGGHNSIDAGTCDELLAVLSSCQRDLVRSESCPLLQPHQEEAVVTAAKDGSSSSAKLVAVFYLVAGAFRDALVAGDSMTLRSSAQLLLRAAEVSKSKAAAFRKDEKVPNTDNCRSRSRSPRRDTPDGVLSSSWTREYWSLCKQVVPLCSAVSLLFLTELRSMQRVVESLGDARMAQYFFSEPHKELQPSVEVAKLSSGEWLKEVRGDLSLAWLQVDWQGPLLRITRSLDSGLGPASHSQLVSQQVLLPHGVLPCLQEELRSLHALNGQKIRELWQRDDKGTEAVRREFWNSRKRFDAELGRIAEKVEQEILGPWRFLLAPWPQTDQAQQTLLAQLDGWIEEAASASHRTLRSAQSRQQPPLRPEDAQQRFLLALLFLEAEKLEAGEIATVLEMFWPGNSSQLRRTASSLKRYRSDCRTVLEAAEMSQEAPLLLYVDATVAQLPLEACACLRHRQVVRGLAPNMTLKALAGAGDVKPRTGYFIIDPAEDCSNMGDVRQLLARWSSHGQAWHGHTGQPMPASKEVLEELCCNDVFIYLGHGERARQLLRQDELQLAGPTKGASQASQASSEESSQESLEEPPGSESAKRGLRSILMLLGCSSVRLQRPSAQGRRGDFESFGLASSALLGGAPLVLGAQWDVLGGDLDRLASRLLQDWLKGVTEEGQAGLLSGRGGVLWHSHVAFGSAPRDVLSFPDCQAVLVSFGLRDVRVGPEAFGAEVPMHVVATLGVIFLALCRFAEGNWLLQCSSCLDQARAGLGPRFLWLAPP